MRGAIVPALRSIRRRVPASLLQNRNVLRERERNGERFGRRCPAFGRFLSSTQVDTTAELLEFPGARVRYTSELKYIPESLEEPVPCFRVLNDYGQRIEGSEVHEVTQDLALMMHERMVMLQVMDNIFYDAQRQGRISFYVMTTGEEAINIASAAALSHDDVVLSQYRESGILMWRGFTLQQFANQCFSNEADYGKGRQMPAHYGCSKLNFFTVSSPIATQLPQAVGVAYSLKMNKEPRCAVTFFGDGGSSEGDFHAAMNFAAVFEVPMLMICRNNGWAISTPASEQFKSDGVVVKGQAYGVRSIRVDGNDALAVYSAVKSARKMAIEESRPILIEVLTYRTGHHSTSDDSSKYRKSEEIEHWRVVRDPVLRFRIWLQNNGWWSKEADLKLRTELRHQMLSALQIAEKAKKPPLKDLFSDVYDNPPKNLKEQEQYIHQVVRRHPEDFPSDIPLN